MTPDFLDNLKEFGPNWEKCLVFEFFEINWIKFFKYDPHNVVWLLLVRLLVMSYELL